MSLLNYQSQVYYVIRKRLRLPDIIVVALALILALLPNKQFGLERSQNTTQFSSPILLGVNVYIEFAIGKCLKLLSRQSILSGKSASHACIVQRYS